MKTLISNNKARYDYDFSDELIAGLVLTGAEVKSAKAGNGSLNGSYVSIKPSGATLIGCHIGAYKYADSDGYNPTRTRALLLNKKEINQLLGKDKGTAIIPLAILDTGRGLVKVKLGIGHGRKKADKREYLKKREAAKAIRAVTGK